MPAGDLPALEIEDIAVGRIRRRAHQRDIARHLVPAHLAPDDQPSVALRHDGFRLGEINQPTLLDSAHGDPDAPKVLAEADRAFDGA
jgi:hypothetical protein